MECTLNDHLVLQLTRVLNCPLSGLKVLELTYGGQKLPVSQLSPKSLCGFFHTLKLNNNLSTLKMSFHIDPTAMQALSESLQYNKGLEILSLINRNLEDASISLLSKNMKDNTTIHTVGLSQNLITDVGADHLIKLLKDNHNLKNIYSVGNKITEQQREILNNLLDRNWLGASQKDCN